MKNTTARVRAVYLDSPSLTGRSDNDGSLSVSAYRGIGSETVRRPVVIAGRDPNIGDGRLTAPYRKAPAGTLVAAATGCFRLSHHQEIGNG